MKRLVCVFLPNFPIDSLRRQEGVLGSAQALSRRPAAAAERRARTALGLDQSGIGRRRPFALVATCTHGLRLSAVNDAATHAGLAPGMRLADARAVVPDLQTRPATPDQDMERLRALARWLGRYGPASNVSDGDGLWVDITGVAHLFAGEAGLIRDMARRLTGAGFGVRIGLADTFGAAHAAARFGGAAGGTCTIIPSGGTAAALAALPVEALRLSPEAVMLLKRLGLRRIGDVEGVPRAALARRFREAHVRRCALKAGRQANAEPGASPGPAAGRRRAPRVEDGAAFRSREALANAVLWRLDQALGRVEEPLSALAPVPRYRERALFETPLATAEGVAQTLHRRLEALCERLAASHEGARAFALGLCRTDGTLARLEVHLIRTIREALHIERLFSERLAGVDLGLGVDALLLEALDCTHLPLRQAVLTTGGGAVSGPDGAELIDRLAGRLGASRVFVARSMESHLPERRSGLRCALEAMTSEGAVSMRPDLDGDPEPAHAASTLRPLFLLRRPEAIEVVAEIPDGPPARMRWRRRSHRIVKAEGPERIAPEWWRAITDPRAGGRVRDYYSIEDEGGGRFWVFRDGCYDGDDAVLKDLMPAWFMHGLLP